MRIPAWTELGALLTASVSRVIYSLPVAGYVILYSDYFRNLFTFNSLNSSWGFLSFSLRINMIYFGSWALLVAVALWWFFSPRLLRGKRDLQHFVSDIVVARDRSTVISIAQAAPFTEPPANVHAVLNETDRLSFSDIAAELKSRKTALGDGAGEYEHRIPTALGYYFKWHNVRNPEIRFLVTALAGLGYFLVLTLPSLDLFLRVLGTHFHP